MWKDRVPSYRIVGWVWLYLHFPRMGITAQAPRKLPKSGAWGGAWPPNLVSSGLPPQPPASMIRDRADKALKWLGSRHHYVTHDLPKVGMDLCLVYVTWRFEQIIEWFCILILAVVLFHRAMLPNQSCPLVWLMVAVCHCARHVPMMVIIPLLQVHL